MEQDSHDQAEPGLIRPQFVSKSAVTVFCLTLLVFSAIGMIAGTTISHAASVDVTPAAWPGIPPAGAMPAPWPGIPPVDATPAARPGIPPADTPMPFPGDTPGAIPAYTPEPNPIDPPVPLPTYIPAPTHDHNHRHRIENPLPLPADTPVPLPTDIPVPTPVDTPVPLPGDTPVAIPTDTPVALPTNIPVPTPADTPVAIPADTPVPTPIHTLAPAVVPTSKPHPTPQPTRTTPPTQVPTPMHTTPQGTVATTPTVSAGPTPISLIQQPSATVNRHGQFAITVPSQKSRFPLSALELGLASLGIGLSLGTGLFFMRRYLGGTTQVNRKVLPSGTPPWERVRATSMDSNASGSMQTAPPLDAFFMNNTGFDGFSDLAFSDSSPMGNVNNSDSTRSRFWSFSDDVPPGVSQQPTPIQEPDWLSLLKQPADVPQTCSEDVPSGVSEQPTPVQEPDWLSLLKQPADVPQTCSQHRLKAVRLVTMAGATRQD